MMPNPASRRHGPLRNWEAAFVVKDNGGQKLAYVYFEEEPRATLSSKVADMGRGAADCDQYCDAARQVPCLPK